MQHSLPHFLRSKTVTMLLALQAASTAALAQTNVSGVLTRSDTGRPVSHAIIHATSTTVAKSTHNLRTETAWDGSFIFGNLPAGTYRFCVHNLDIHLNPCEWPTVNAAVPVQISASDPKLRLKVDPGRRVHLRVQDSAGLLTAALAGGRKPEVAVLIVDKSGKTLRRVPTLGAPTAGHYSLLVPDDPSYGFAVASPDVNLSDDRGSVIADRAFIPFANPLSPEARALLARQFHAEPDDPAVVVKVAGRKP